MENKIFERTLSDMVPEGYAEKLKQLKILQKEIKMMEDAFKDNLCEMMGRANIVEMCVDGVKFRYINGTVRETFDSKKFMAEHPKMYKEYITNTPVSEYIRTTVV